MNFSQGDSWWKNQVTFVFMGFRSYKDPKAHQSSIIVRFGPGCESVLWSDEEVWYEIGFWSCF
jgi:hypothetical protein